MKKNGSSKRFFTVSYLRRSRRLSRYLEEKPWVRHFYRDFLELRSGMRIVDVGCGTGEFTRQLAKLVPGRCRIIGVDSRTPSLRTALSETKKAGLSGRISYKKGDALVIPIEDDFADLTCCRSLLMHLTDPLRAVVEMERVTKPGGIVAALESGLMSSFYDPEDEPFAELDVEMGRAYLKGLRKLEGKEFAIGERLPNFFQKAGLEEIRVEVVANAWTPCDARFKKDQLKATVEFWYQLFKEGRDAERRMLLAGGIQRREITSYLSQCEKWYREVSASADNVKNRAIVMGSALFVVVGQKITSAREL